MKVEIVLSKEDNKEILDWCKNYRSKLSDMMWNNKSISGGVNVVTPTKFSYENITYDAESNEFRFYTNVDNSHIKECEILDTIDIRNLNNFMDFLVHIQNENI